MKIKEAIKEKITGEWGDEDDVGLGVQILRTTNFTNAGRISYEKVVKRNIPNSLVEKKKLLPGDIIIEKSGGSPNQPVGRVVFFDNNDDLFLCNNFTAILRPSERLVPKYFFYDLFYKYLSQVTLRYQNKTTGIINLQLDRYLEEKINVPSFDKQKQIVQILDTADTLRQKRKEQLNLLDDYLKSVFFEMFGDPIMNQKKWEVRSLKEITNLITDGKHGDCRNDEDSGYYFISAKDIHDGIIDYSQARQILKEDFEEVHRRTNLAVDDLVMVNTGATIGKTAIVDNDIRTGSTTFQKSVAIIKPMVNKLTSTYLKYVFILRIKAFAGISSGSAQKNLLLSQMRVFKIPLPPLTLQNKFTSIVEQVEQTKQKIHTSLGEMDNHFNALMQRYFG